MSMHFSLLFVNIYVDFFTDNATILYIIIVEVTEILEYKIDIIEELEKIGVNTTKARETGIFGQSTMKKFKNKDTSISLDNLNRLCAILEMQPRDIIKYIETDNDRENYISKISDNSIDFH